MKYERTTNYNAIHLNLGVKVLVFGLAMNIQDLREQSNLI